MKTAPWHTKTSRQIRSHKVPTHKWLVPLIILIGFPFLVNILLVAGVLTSNPLVLFGGLTTHLVPGLHGGSPTIDPNVGFTSQALGFLSDKTWLSGHIPWWNRYEGVGAPLAGEMQSAAFFPITFLFLLPHGELWVHIILQLIAGISTYYLLRTLGLSRTASLCGGMLFEVNGTFSWLANAVDNPIPFLPLLLLGVEQTRKALSCKRPDSDSLNVRPHVKSQAGWVIIAIALALSIYAGFPEVAYIDLLFVALWVIWRFTQLQSCKRTGFILKLLLGGAVGLLLSAPVIVAFLGYLPYSTLGGIGGAVEGAGSSLSGLGLMTLVMPYAFGPIWHYPSALIDGLKIAKQWRHVGGYLSCGILLLSVSALINKPKKDRGLRFLLAFWTAISLMRTFGVTVISALVNHIPLVGLSAFYRYASPTWELATIILASMAVNDFETHHRNKNAITLLSAALILLLSGVTVTAINFTVIKSVFHSLSAWIIFSIVLLIGVGFVSVITAVAVSQPRYQARIMFVTVLCESSLFFLIPTAYNPKSATVDTQAVNFLQKNLGLRRFITLGPISPNYGSYYKISSVNYNDAPVPRVWFNYVKQHLDPYVSTIPTSFYAYNQSALTKEEDSLKHNLAAYEAVGVKYVVTSSTNPITGVGPPVYHDEVMDIYSLQKSSPYFSAKGCTVSNISYNFATTYCKHNSYLIRRELFMAGWRATLNGSNVHISSYHSAFEEIPIPKGRAYTVYSYTPPHIVIGIAAFYLGIFILLIAGLLSKSRYPLHRPKHKMVAHHNNRQPLD
ncbi:MAG: hypothetical protein M1483_06915 [Actinobacteria bacterium]|nr:hypothetical protein [Actinomycetota bacterium]MCL6105339.1 hypothetical protein [Actinomycetota bacterium]